MFESSMYFKNTWKHIEEVLNQLMCCFCKRIPEDRNVWICHCTHKYCHKCFKTLDQKPIDGRNVKKCKICAQLSIENGYSPYKLDQFSTALLKRVLTFQNQLQMLVNQAEHEKEVSRKETEKDLEDFLQEPEIKLPELSPKKIVEDEGNVATIIQKPRKFFKEPRNKIVSTNSITPKRISKRRREYKTKPSISITEDVGSATEAKEDVSVKLKGKRKTKVVQELPSKKMLRSASVSNSVASNTSKASSVFLESIDSKVQKHESTTSSTLDSSFRKSPNVSISTTSKKRSSGINAKGETQLHIAARSGQITKIKQLLETSIDINAKDFAGWTPLHEAVAATAKHPTDLSVVETLLENNCQVNIIGGSGETVLHEAIRFRNFELVKLLLTYSASTEIPNEAGKLPRDICENSEVLDLLNNFKGPYKRELNEVELESSLLSLRQSKILLYFSYEVDSGLIEEIQSSFNLKISKEFNERVTHVIFNAKKEDGPVKISLDFLRGLVTGAWLLSSQWLTVCVQRMELIDPTPYEIEGILDSGNDLLQYPSSTGPAQKISRQNREAKNPGLFHGIVFYIYKNSCFNSGGIGIKPKKNSKRISSTLELSKKEIAQCLQLGNGEIVNREPSVNSIDPLDHLERFHAKGTHPLSFTSHIILFSNGKGNEPAKKHNLDHLKTLNVNWVVHSILRFQLCSPERFYG